MANLAGIEQSYLSKLENDKSLPSSEILRQLLTAFSLSLSAFLQNFDRDYLNKQLAQIPDVEYWLLQQDKSQLSSQRRILYVCSALIVLAVTMFYTGYSKILFNEYQFQYYSRGVVLEGEPKRIFYEWQELIPQDGSAVARALYSKKKIEMTQRKNEQYLLSPKYLGEEFVEQHENGQRIFSQRGDKHVPNVLNAWLQIIAVLLFSGGVMGFIIERRISRL